MLATVVHNTFKVIKVEVMFKLKFGVGLQLIRMTKDEFIKIIDDYHQHIEYIYYSSLLDKKYYARKIVSVKEQAKFYEINHADQYEILEYARNKYGIKTELCVNAYACKSDEDFIKMFEYEIAHHKPDKCVTYNRLVDRLKCIDPSISFELSFNEGLLFYDDIDKVSNNFDSIVIGGRFIRDINMINKILMSGRTPNILINNGCAFNCGYCGRCDCLKVFDRNLKVSNNDINIPFAIQTLLPFELYNNDKVYTDDLYYKLSTRLCNYDELDFLMKSYVNNLNTVSNMTEFHAICPLRHFEKYYNDINMDDVIKYKIRLWDKIGNK